jgi:GNAT superfamily N-acetyltransferase
VLGADHHGVIEFPSDVPVRPILQGLDGAGPYDLRDYARQQPWPVHVYDAADFADDPRLSGGSAGAPPAELSLLVTRDSSLCIVEAFCGDITVHARALAEGRMAFVDTALFEQEDPDGALVVDGVAPPAYVGGLSVNLDHTDIAGVSLLPQWQRRRIGSMMLAAAEHSLTIWAGRDVAISHSNIQTDQAVAWSDFTTSEGLASAQRRTRAQELGHEVEQLVDPISELELPERHFDD